MALNPIVEEIVCKCCDFILIKGDSLVAADLSKYLQDLSPDRIKLLESVGQNEIDDLHSVIQDRVSRYIDQYPIQDQDITPFAFAAANSFDDFCIQLAKNYRKNTGNAFPYALTYVLSQIRDKIDTVFLVEKYNNIFGQIIKSSLEDSIGSKVESEVGKAIKTQLDGITKRALDSAEKAAVEAEYASNNAKKAVKEAVNSEMPRVSKEISQSSVTILGIFAAIVLTIVGGLFYFVWKMNHFEKEFIKYSKVRFVNILLVSLMIAFTVLYFVIPVDKNKCENNDQKIVETESVIDESSMIADSDNPLYYTTYVSDDSK